MEPRPESWRERAGVLKERKRRRSGHVRGWDPARHLGRQGPDAGVQETAPACFLEFSFILIAGTHHHGAIGRVHIRANVEGVLWSSVPRDDFFLSCVNGTFTAVFGPGGSFARV